MPEPKPGDKFAVGTICSVTGRYEHSACKDTAIYNKGNKFAPCSKADCRNKGADWVLKNRLT